MVAEWGDEGEIDLLDFFAELTIYNTAACLVGLPFREEIDHRFAEAYHGLERGTDALAYVDPYMEGVESFEIRDRSRETLVELVQGIIDRRKAARHGGRARTATCSTCSSRIDMSADYITGIFISMLFAGHHTSSGTSAWTLIELMRHPDVMAEVVDGARRPVRRRLGDLVPGAAVDPEAGVGHQGDAAAAPAADHPDAPGRGGDRAGRAHDPRRHDRGLLAAGLQPARGGLPGRAVLRPGPLPRPAPGGPAEPLDLDPVRRRQAPLRRQRVRDDADQGDLLGDAARLRVRAGAAERDLPRRLLQDGHPAAAAVPSALPRGIRLPA